MRLAVFIFVAAMALLFDIFVTKTSLTSKPIAYSYLTITSVLIVVGLVNTYLATMNILSSRAITSLGKVTRTSKYIKGKGFVACLNLHMDRRVGIKRLKKVQTLSEKNLIIYNNFWSMVLMLKGFLREGQGIYNGIKIIRAVSPLLTKRRMEDLGIEVKELKSFSAKIIYWFSMFFLGVKVNPKKKIYYFELTVEEFLKIDENKIYDQIDKIKCRINYATSE
jgi:hypothetical protein